MPRKYFTKKKSIFLKSLLFFVSMVGVFILIVDREQLPEPLRSHKAAISVYDMRDRLLKNNTGVKKFAPVTPAQKGYSGSDRGEMEKLISKGAHD